MVDFFSTIKLLFSQKTTKYHLTTNSDHQNLFFLFPLPLFLPFFFLKSAKILEEKKKEKRLFDSLNIIVYKISQTFKISLRASRIVIFEALIKIEDKIG